MLLNKKHLLGLFWILSSCSNDSTLTDFLANQKSLKIRSSYTAVAVKNMKISKVQTDNLLGYKLGKISNPIYGESQAQILSQLGLSRTSPIFGKYSQEKENSADTDNDSSTIDEKEIVTSVMLYIPFFSSFQRNENLQIKQNENARLYNLDSIYGNTNATFKIKIEESNYYLGDYDVNDLSKNKIYYSNEDFSTKKGSILANLPKKINDSEILIYKEDNKDTEANESLEVKTRISPRMQIQLDTDFFQKKIIDKEGSDILKQNKDFKNYMKGIYISMYDLSSNLMMYLDIKKAYIEIKYSYKSVNKDVTENKESTFNLNLTGHIINLLSFKDISNLSKDENKNDAKRIHLNGSEFITEIKLFHGEDLKKLRQNKWLINDATLVFKEDKIALAGATESSPYRIYLYNLDSGTPLIDIDPRNNKLNSQSLIYGGTLIKDGDETLYKIKITTHVNRILRKDSTNVRLGLVITSNLNDNLTFLKAYNVDNKTLKVPRSALVNPLGTILYGGNSSVAEDKRLRLEIHYTEFEK